MRQNLTMEEIYALSPRADVSLIEKIRPMLTEQQIVAIQSMSYEELKEAVWTLVAVAQEQGVGGGSADVTAEETTSAEMTTFPEEVSGEATGEAAAPPEVTTAQTEAAVK